MKIRSLLLGSIAAAGLATGAQAADLGVLTSLDVCDSLGLSGLTISSDTNCLQITGMVSYRLRYGDFNNNVAVFNGNLGGAINAGALGNELDGSGIVDWDSRVQARLGLVATADSEFGPATAHITFYREDEDRFRDGVAGVGVNDTTAAGGIVISEAWVSVGDSTMLIAGRRGNPGTGSVFNGGTDAPYNYLGTFQSQANANGAFLWNIPTQNSPFGGGVWFNDNGGSDIRFGGDVIQVVSDLGNGFDVAVGLENITDNAWFGQAPNLARAGTLVGAVNYKGDSVTAHVSGAAGGVLDGIVDWFGVHAGAEVRFDNFKILGAIAANNLGFVNGLASAQAEFDMFTLAVSGDFSTGNGKPTQVGFGASIGAKVTDGVAINLGGRWADPNTAAAGNEVAQIAAQVVASVTETITLTGEVGADFAPARNIPFVAGIVAWNPGGGFTTSLRGDATFADATPGYRVEFNAAKSFN